MYIASIIKSEKCLLTEFYAYW